MKQILKRFTAIIWVVLFSVGLMVVQADAWADVPTKYVQPTIAEPVEESGDTELELIGINNFSENTIHIGVTGGKCYNTHYVIPPNTPLGLDTRTCGPIYDDVTLIVEPTIGEKYEARVYFKLPSP
ncbi:MAG: hypothetical protein F6K58_27395 [Symploca sp. SIO2E9]|nr:hypothetical protein [Symploca sp. SIO2E9]